MNRNVWLLFCCQALINVAMVGQTAMSALIGYSLAGDKALSTLPLAIQMLATMAASIPAGLIFARLGRRPGFLLGAAASLVGSLVFADGIWRESFWLYCLGAVPCGLGFGIGMHYRFAAAEVVDASARARAIALVLAGSVAAAVIGPEIVKRSKDFFAPAQFLGTYLVLIVPPLLCALLLAFTRLPPAPRRTTAHTPLRTIISRPAFIVAVVAGMTAYGSMNLIMTSTPLEMTACGFSVNTTIDVIRAHAIAMYGPGFFSGFLIQRFGARPIVCIGAAFILACAGLSWTGSAFGYFVVALMLLGIGWNFMFVGATAMQSASHDMQDRVRTQAANDFIVFGTVACTAFLSGLMHRDAGWLAVNMAVVPIVLVTLALVLWPRAERASAAARA